MSEQEPDPGRRKQADKYSQLMRRLSILELVLGGLYLLVILVSGLSGELRSFLDFPQPARVALYFLIVMLGYVIVSAPLNIYHSFVVPRRYGISRQSWSAWLTDEAKEVMLGSALGICLVLTIYLFLEFFPQTWWLLAFAFMSLVIIIMTKLAPVLILPLFFKLEPLANLELRSRLLGLAERCGLKIKEVFLINFSGKTTAGNAMLMGWGNTMRVALSDTLFQRYTPAEIEVIMAHEIAHNRHRDIAKLIAMQSVLMFLAFYMANLVFRWAVPQLGFDAISDVAAFPLLVLIIAAIALVMGPLLNTYSRHLEKAADIFALDCTANPDAFVSMLTKLSDQNLTESEPGRWTELLFYDHPPYHKRTELARHYRKEAQLCD